MKTMIQKLEAIADKFNKRGERARSNKRTRDEVRELAEAYVVGYTMSELGIDYGMLCDILETHRLLRESEVEAMTEDEFNAATDAATAETVEAAADALGELMEG